MESITPLEASRRAPFGQIVGCFLLLLAGLHLAAGPVVQLSQWYVDPQTNVALAEAQAWQDGRLDLPFRMHDTALFDGRVYNVFPPLFTLLAFAAISIGPIFGVPEGQFYAPWYVMLVALPLPIAGYWMFLKAVGRPAWAAFFTGFWILATPVLPCLALPGEAGINQDMHLLSQTGLMLIVGTLLGGRRLWPGVVGLIIVAWSRPPCLLFVIPLFLAIRHGEAALVRKRLTGLAAALILILALPMGFSWAKFGSPFESGYRYIYEGREDKLAQRGREALFSVTNIPRNAWYMNCELPGWEFGTYGVRPVVSSDGASIWFTMPLLAFVLIDARRWWRHRAERWLMLTSLGVIASLLLYHNTGYIQPGYYRFCLDFLPVWLAVAAARVMITTDRPRWVIAAAAWGMIYFRLVTELYLPLPI